MTNKNDNYAFIDSRDLNLAIRGLLIPNQQKYSALLKFDIFKPYRRFVSDLRKKLEYNPKKKNPHKDKTLKGKTSIGDTPTYGKKTK